MISRIQWQSPHHLMLALCILFCSTVAIAWLYRGELKNLPSHLRALPLLRMLALGLLALSILRPTILVPRNEEQRGTVLMLVDQSRSMNVVDSGRSEAELVQLAGSLGMLSEELRPSGLFKLRQQLVDLRQLDDELSRSRIELDYARLSGQGIEPATAHLRAAAAELSARIKLVSAAAPQTLAANIAKIDGELPRQRIEQVIDLVDQMQRSDDSALYRSDVQVRRVCADLAQRTRIELVHRALESDSKVIDQIGKTRPIRFFGYTRTTGPLECAEELSADGVGSDLASAYRTLRQTFANDRVGALVVFTDGRRIPGDSPDAPNWPDMPTFVVSPAEAIQHDLSIAFVALPPAAFAGETFDVVVTVHSVGFEGERVHVSVQSAGQEKAEWGEIRQNIATVTLQCSLQKSGPQELEIKVAPLPGETIDENNRVRRTIRIINDRQRVMLLAGVASWENQNLKSSLAADAGVRVDARLVDSTHNGPSPDEILAQDLVILQDLPAETLDTRQWDALTRLVNEKGASVLLTTIDPSIVTGYSANPLAASMLPWRGDSPAVTRVWPGEEEIFRLVPPEIDPADPTRAAIANNLRDAFLINPADVPSIFRFLAIPTLRASAKPLLVEHDSNLPVLTEQKMGAGKVLFLGTNEMWRSRLGASSENRWWPALVRRATRTPFVLRRGDLALDADSFQLDLGESLHVRCVVPSAGGTVTLWRGSTVAFSRTFESGGEGNRLELTIPDLQEGNYDLSLTGASASDALSFPIEVQPNAESEMRDVSPDDANLRRITGSRGDVLRLSEIQSLPQRLASIRDTDPQFTELRLWDSPYLFLFVLGCFGLEWAVRKQVGLI